MSFIYVMDEESRDQLLSMGYKLIKENEANGVWVFDNPDKLSFSAELNVPHVASNILTF